MKKKKKQCVIQRGEREGRFGKKEAVGGDNPSVWRKKNLMVITAFSIFFSIFQIFQIFLIYFLLH